MINIINQSKYWEWSCISINWSRLLSCGDRRQWNIVLCLETKSSVLATIIFCWNHSSHQLQVITTSVWNWRVTVRITADVFSHIYHLLSLNIPWSTWKGFLTPDNRVLSVVSIFHIHHSCVSLYLQRVKGLKEDTGEAVIIVVVDDNAADWVCCVCKYYRVGEC